MTDTATLSRSGFLDPQNEKTRTHVVDLNVTKLSILAECGTCGAAGYWLLEDVEEAANAIREHYGDRCMP